MKLGLILLFLIVFLSTVLVAQQEIIEYEAFFLHNKSELTDLEKNKLTIFHDSILANYSITNMSIIGYANEIGGHEYNHRLSTDRANYIHQFILNENLKIPTEVVGKGEIITRKEKDYKNQLIENRKAVMRYAVYSRLVHTASISEFAAGEKMTIKSIGFYPDSPVYLPQSEPTLLKLVEDLSKNKSYYIQIQGHIYDPNNYEKDRVYPDTNPTLSEDRAKTIYLFLIQNGIDSTRLSYVGFQGKYPLNKKPQEDRRVEIEVIKIQPE